MIFRDGVGVVARMAESALWWQSASDKGHVDAMVRLGELYETGAGVAQDGVTAVRLYQTAAARGHPEAQFRLGNLFEAGFGAAQDFFEAYVWLNLAAANGWHHAVAARDTVARRLSAAALGRAQKQARDRDHAHRLETRVRELEGQASGG